MYHSGAANHLVRLLHSATVLRTDHPKGRAVYGGDTFASTVLLWRPLGLRPYSTDRDVNPGHGCPCRKRFITKPPLPGFILWQSRTLSRAYGMPATGAMNFIPSDLARALPTHPDRQCSNYARCGKPQTFPDHQGNRLCRPRKWALLPDFQATVFQFFCLSGHMGIRYRSIGGTPEVGGSIFLGEGQSKQGLVSLCCHAASQPWVKEK